jgi:phosphatidate cytidylyltransferase
MSSSGTKQRIVVGLLTTIVSLLVILFSHNPWVHPLFFAVIFLMIWGSLHEFENICRLKGVQPETKTAVVLSFFYLLALVFAPKTPVVFLLPFGFLVFSLITFFLRQFKRGSAPLMTLSLSLFGLLYLTLPLASLYQIAFLYPEMGPLWLLYLVVVVKLSDTVAYFVGSRMGKNKLAPYISPKKTVEGAIGGVIGSIIGSLGFHFFSPLPLGFWESILLGILLGILAELGDLSESLIKREVAIKDSNHLPGLGGILDMVDSLLFATPVFLIYLLL